MKKLTKRPMAYEQILAHRGISLPISQKNAKIIHQAFNQRIQRPVKIGLLANICLLDIAIMAELNAGESSG